MSSRSTTLAVEDAQNFGQRPKLEDYDDFMYMVVHGAGPTTRRPIEVHFILAEHFVVTVHHGALPGHGRGARQRLSHRSRPISNRHGIALVYLVIDQLVDSFFPMLNEFDNQIDELEDAILVQPTEAQLGTLFTMKRSLITIRKVVTPQRDMFASISSGVDQLPGVTDEGLRYMRDIYDHLIRISDLVDGYRDLLSGVMDTHLSTVSNRLNVVMKQLTIIATVFLPLSFLTGFFGQNFSLAGRPHHRSGALPRLRARPRAGIRGRPPLPIPQARLAGGTHQLSRPTAPTCGHDRRTATRNESTEAIEAHERIEATPRKLPTEATDRADPIDTERIDPTDPMERIEPAELIDRIESRRVDRPPRPPASSRSMPQSVPAGARSRPQRRLDRVARRIDHVPAPAGVGERLAGGLARRPVRRPQIERPAVVGDLGGPVGTGRGAEQPGLDPRARPPVPPPRPGG